MASNTPFIEERLNRLKNWMEQEGVDGFLVSGPENRFYMSGFCGDDVSFTESAGRLLITMKDRFLITDSRYSEEAESECPNFEVLLYDKEMSLTIAELLTELDIRRVALEKDYVTIAFYDSLKKHLRDKNARLEVVGYSGVIENMRAVKTEEEIELIKRSLEITESAMETVFSLLDKGYSEKELAWIVEEKIRTSGAEALAFSPIVATGPNAAKPHAVPTTRKPRAGETIIIDIGAKLDRYCSDMTRTFAIGKMDIKWREIYRVVRQAQLEAQSFIKPGVRSTEVDQVARSVIEKGGYGQYFGHGLGHGVGLAVHELPGLRKDKPVELRPNMVVTIEPGIYIPGKGGVRLENMVRITNDNAELLNKKGLFIGEDI